MKVALAHNWYRTKTPSGENVVVERERALLEAAGVEVRPIFAYSDDLERAGLPAKVRAGFGLHALPWTVANRARELQALRVDVLHVHNVWPLLTYGLLEAAHRIGLPTVQTLHNYRLFGTNTHFIDRGTMRRPCTQEETIHLRRFATQHEGAFRNWLYTRAIDLYWRRRIPQRCVDAYICLTRFQRDLAARAGLPPEKLVVKPNSVTKAQTLDSAPGTYALFVGRLSSEKGVDFLVRAWPRTGLALKVVGDGPLKPALVGQPGIEMLGSQSSDRVRELMAGARVLVMSSIWYEGLPLVLVEALSVGTPCLVPALGALPSVVGDHVHGRVFPPDDAEAFARIARELWATAPGKRIACRSEYERRYTPERNVQALLAIYDNVMARRPIATGLDL